MKWLRNLIAEYRVKHLDNALMGVREKAIQVYNKKGDVVVCFYCGKLLPKSEAWCVYDIASGEIAYDHNECFEKYNHAFKGSALKDAGVEVEE